jgi:hypothetical protein
MKGGSHFMAEITKISSPLIPKENVGNRFKPNTDQAFELTDPSKIHKPSQDGKIFEQRPEGQALRDSMGRAAIASLLKDTGDLTAIIKRLAYLVETGLSTTEVMEDPEVRQLLNSAFVSREEMAASFQEQERAAVLFRGEAFDVLRDLLAKFPDNPRIRDAVASLLKAFEYHVNTGGSIRAILTNCENILEYLFSKDRAQFSEYLQGLTQTILPKEETATQNPRLPQNAEQTTQARPGEAARSANTQTQPEGAARPANAQTQPAELPQQANAPSQPAQATQNPAIRQDAAENAAPAAPQGAEGQGQTPPAAQQDAAEGRGQVWPENAPPPQNTQARAATPLQESLLPIPQKEIAQILKGNLLPLLGEIVVKYNQNDKIRDHVMVTVHNTVRVDQGTPEAVRAAITKLVRELRQVAYLPENFARNLTDAIFQNSREAKFSGNRVMETFAEVISEALRSEQSSPATIRQAETLLMSLLQNQSAIMDVLHYVVPIQMGSDQMIAELYIDPDSENGDGRSEGKESRKLFLAFESPTHGAFELSFMQIGDRVDFAMWCPSALVNALSGMKRNISDLMQIHGYTMNSFSIDEYKRPQSVAEVFPNLLNRRVGIDVRV